ncbi:MAG: hypothetical protein FJX76_11560 [Armatimonadetes bacterium]|nr:hypothetical protein [Armatimonadota bacterium]
MNTLHSRSQGFAKSRRATVRRLRTPDFTWDDARNALDSIFWNGLANADRAGLYRRNFLGFTVKVKDVAAALSMIFRGETLYVRTPQARYEKIRDLQDLKEIYTLWSADTAQSEKDEKPSQVVVPIRRIA